MKIIIVVPYLTAIGGASRFAWEFSEYLALKGDQVVVVSLFTDRTLYTSKENIKIIDLADRTSFTQTLKFWVNLGKISKKLSLLVKNEKPDLVFFNHFPCMLWVQKYDNIPIICYPEDIAFLYSDNYTKNLPLWKYVLWNIIRIFVRIYDRKKWKCFDHVICNSKFTANHVSRVYGIKPTLIYFGTNTEVFTNYNLHYKSRAILSMGDTRIRRADLLLKAASKLHQKRNDFKIWIVGNNGQLDKKYKKLVAKYNLTEVVEFFGRVNDSTLAKLYSEALAVVHLVKEAPFGFIVIEAMACETPVIAWKPGGTEESIIHGETGFLIEENDSDGLIKYMEKFLDEPQLSHVMGKKGRLRIQNYFDKSKQNNQLREFLLNCIHKN
ncbi:MAG: glycosyltransferase family 4 protein [Nitrosopumilaceae archaeon]